MSSRCGPLLTGCNVQLTKNLVYLNSKPVACIHLSACMHVCVYDLPFPCSTQYIEKSVFIPCVSVPMPLLPDR